MSPWSPVILRRPLGQAGLIWVLVSGRLSPGEVLISGSRGTSTVLSDERRDTVICSFVLFSMTRHQSLAQHTAITQTLAGLSDVWIQKYVFILLFTFNKAAIASLMKGLVWAVCSDEYCSSKICIWFIFCFVLATQPRGGKTQRPRLPVPGIRHPHTLAAQRLPSDFSAGQGVAAGTGVKTGASRNNSRVLLHPIFLAPL